MKTTQNINLTASTTLFSLDQLNKIGNNDETFTKQMLEKFIIQALECSNSLSSAIISSDWTKLRSIAHKNIPSYSIMGNNELVNLLKYVEIQSEKNKEYGHMLEIVEIICEKNNTVIDAIKNHIKLMHVGKVNPDDN